MTASSSDSSDRISEPWLPDRRGRIPAEHPGGASRRPVPHRARAGGRWTRPRSAGVGAGARILRGRTPDRGVRGREAPPDGVLGGVRGDRPARRIRRRAPDPPDTSHGDGSGCERTAARTDGRRGAGLDLASESGAGSGVRGASSARALIRRRSGPCRAARPAWRIVSERARRARAAALPGSLQGIAAPRRPLSHPRSHRRYEGARRRS